MADLTEAVSGGFPASIRQIEQNFQKVYGEIAKREGAAKKSGKALKQGTKETMSESKSQLKGVRSDLTGMAKEGLGSLAGLGAGTSVAPIMAPAFGALELMRAGEVAANRFLQPGLTTYFSGVRSQAQAGEAEAMAEERRRQQELLAQATIEQARLNMERARMQQEAMLTREGFASERELTQLRIAAERGDEAARARLQELELQSASLGIEEQKLRNEGIKLENQKEGGGKFGNTDISADRAAAMSGDQRDQIRHTYAYQRLKRYLYSRIQGQGVWADKPEMRDPAVALADLIRQYGDQFPQSLSVLLWEAGQ